MKIPEIFFYDPARPLIFNAGEFLLLFSGFYLGWALLFSKVRPRTLWALAFSLFFYYKTSGIYLLGLIFNAWLCYKAGRGIEDSDKPAVRKGWLFAGLAVSLGQLAYFKYTNFLFSTAAAWTGTEPVHFDIFLPIGISFYTFQTLSYVVDVYRKDLRASRDFPDFLFYVSYFPQLVAGPILRASDFIVQIREKLTVSREDISRAFVLISGGLFKKVVISDYLSRSIVDRVFEDPSGYSALENLMAIYGYALQIYGDFSGYSDMAIGLGLLMGFRICENFNAPYSAWSVTEFWHRWHISLSTWLRDYLYFPLGGNRKGKARTYVNLALTMLLGGLWHGAGWKFVAWGGLHGAGLALEKALGLGRRPDSASIRWLGRIFTFHFVCLGWVFFRADSFSTGWRMLSTLGRGIEWNLLGQFHAGYPWVLFLVLLGFLLHSIPASAEAWFQGQFGRLPLPLQSLGLALAVWVVIQAASPGFQPFIYFQF